VGAAATEPPRRTSGEENRIDGPKERERKKEREGERMAKGQTSMDRYGLLGLFWTQQKLKEKESTECSQLTRVKPPVRVVPVSAPPLFAA